MYNYREPPPIPTSDERYEKGKLIGKFDIDILADTLQTYTYWSGFRRSNFKRFPNHPVLQILKKIYDI